MIIIDDIEEEWKKYYYGISGGYADEKIRKSE